MSTGLVLFAVVVHDSVPVTFDVSDAGEYVIAGLEGDRTMLGVVPYALFELTETVSSGVVMMSPLLAVAMKQRALLQAAPLICVMPVGPAFNAETGPLMGLPCSSHVVPALPVASTVPIAPPAKQ